MATSSSSMFSTTDSWLADLLTTPENQTLTKAFQHITSSKPTHPQIHATAKRHVLDLPPTKKLTKRKSRAAKKTHTTYITADPANFRQMVQQVTGFHFNNNMQEQEVQHSSVIVRPEAQRPRCHGLCLPATLDTSAFSVDQVGLGSAGDAVVEFGGFPTLESSFARVVDSGFF